MTTRRDVALGLAASAALVATPANAQVTVQGPGDPVATSDRARPIVPLWARPPGAPRRLPVEVVLERAQPPALRDRAVTHTARPRMVVFRPERPNGAAILLCPGGGYQRVVADKEGYESAERFNAARVTVFVLFYRLPGDGWAAGPDVSLQDAQRAMRMIRAGASNYGVDPNRIGVLGFSAGGHVAGSLTLRWDADVYPRRDSVDRPDAKPNFSLLLYPVVSMQAPHGHGGSHDALLGANASADLERRYSLDLLARPDAPPTFILTAADDNAVPMENSLLLYNALRARRVPVELHVFEAGGHGFGTRLTVGKPTAAWPDLALAWMRAHQMMGA